VFGAPAHVYLVGGTRVLVWHKNLLTDVQPPPAQPGHGSVLPPGALPAITRTPGGTSAATR